MSVRPTRSLTRVFIAVLTAIVAVTTALMSGGAASAAPANNAVKYKISQIDSKVLLSVTDGTITQDGNLVSIRNKAGKAVWAMPLTYSLENKQFPIELVKYSSNRVALVPIKDLSRATPADAKQVAYSRKVTQDYASNGYRSRQERDDAALRRFNSEASAGITITSIIFAVIGVIDNTLWASMRTVTDELERLLRDHHGVGRVERIELNHMGGTFADQLAAIGPFGTRVDGVVSGLGN